MVRTRAEYWKYKGGKQGQGNWKWMDADLSRKLEDAYLAGQEELTVEEDGWAYFYDLKEMTQTSIPADDTAPVTRAVQRVINSIEA